MIQHKLLPNAIRIAVGIETPGGNLDASGENMSRVDAVIKSALLGIYMS